MSRTRAAALAAIFIVIAAAAFALTREKRTQSPGERPVLLYLSSLPILFGEDFSLDTPASPVLETLRTRFALVPIDVTDPPSLAKGRLLFMAQPRAQPPENLVALDDWVRRGGRAVLFADPVLEWPSGKPPTDPTGPPRSFADTGLLGHWGVRLDAPDERGPARVRIEGRDVATLSPGVLNGGCRIENGGLIADCAIGKGRAIVVADADFLNVGGEAPEAAGNVAAIESLLDRLTSR